MKILYIIDSLGVGGAEVLLKNTLLELQKYNFDITVYTLKKTNSFVEKELENTNIKIIYNDKSFYTLSHILAIKTLLQKQSYDIIHVHLFPAQLWAAIAMRITSNKIPIKITTEHSTHNRRWNKKAWKIVDFFMYNTYDNILTISKATKINLVKWQPKMQKKCILLYNGIPKPTHQNALEQYLPHSSFNILTIGSLTHVKGHSFLFEVLSQLESKNWHLHLLGEGPLLQSLVTQAKTLNISHNITFHGFKANIPEYFKQTTLYIQPSQWEGFGIATLEAMAAGLPILASDVDGLNEVVEEAGLLLPYGELELWVKQLEDLIKSPIQLTQLALKSQQQAQKFSLKNHMKKLLQIYKFNSL